MTSSYSIYMDMQRNSFYRIDKQTGQRVKSYINGDKVPSFKPQITGFEYQLRKNNTIHKQYSEAEPRHVRLNQSLGSYSPKDKDSKLHKFLFTTINHTDSNSITSRLSKHNNTIIKSARQKQRSISQYTFQPNSTKYLHQSIISKKRKQLSQQNQSPKEKSNQVSASLMTSITSLDSKYAVQEDRLVAKIRDYQKIQQNKVRDNNSPLKDKDGSVERKEDILDQLCITKTSFKRSLDAVNKQIFNQKQQKKQKKLNKYNNNLQNYSVQKQLKQQRRFKLMPLEDVKVKRSQKNHQRDKLRNQNLKKLQKQMLSRNQRSQMQIFNSKQK